jgi:Ca2+:H+ antiporter
MIWATISSNPINSLLVFVPLGIVAGAIGSNPPLVFLLNFFAIIPLASVMSFATEELSVKLGSTLGGLVNATFGNAVEMIVRRGRPADEFCELIMGALGQHSRAPEQ